jgi:hypothetical protein
VQYGGRYQTRLFSVATLCARQQSKIARGALRLINRKV